MTESLSYYFQELKKCKILDKEEINRLIVKAQAGDNRARDKIIMSNLRFVVTIAKSFEIKGMPLEDLISSGNEAYFMLLQNLILTKVRLLFLMLLIG